MSFMKGLFTGAVLTGVLCWKAMPKMMLNIHKSRFGLEETVARLEQASIKAGWKVPKIYNIQETLAGAGLPGIGKIQILSICHPGRAYDILKNDLDKKVAAIMPCRIGVYEDGQNNVFVANMNIGLMSKMFGGNIARVMGSVAEEEKAILSSVL